MISRIAESLFLLRPPRCDGENLLDDFRYCSRTHRVAAFANREAQALLQSHRRDQRHFAAHVISRHHHLHSRRQLHIPSHVRRTEVKLRPVPREKRCLSPASPSSSSFLNISTPVTTFFCVGRNPTISISSPTFTLPRSIRPVTTVPRPEIEKISSIGMANGLSTSRTGSGTFLSTASINSSIVFSHFASPFSACKAEPLITAMVSPGN